MDQLLEKLAISKAIMDKHNQIKRGGATEPAINSFEMPQVQDFSAPMANYNIPQEFLSEENIPVAKKTSNQPMSEDAIMKSRLPDEIKKLMIENPIVATNPLVNSGIALSDEMIEKATKLMGTNKPELQPARKITNTPQPQANNNDLKKMIKEVVQEVLKENGLIAESTSKTSEIVSIKVGQHIFEGKITKIKKIA